jgi:hypothetical protein
VSESQSILNPQPHTIKLAGREYQVGPYSMRRVRELCSELAPLHDKIQDANGHPLRMIAIANDVLDFFYAISPEMAKDRDVLDEATETEITETLTGYFGYVFAPLARRAEAQVASDAVPPAPETAPPEANETKFAS